MGWQLNIPMPDKPREPVKLPEKEKFEMTLVFINNVLQDNPELDAKIKNKIRDKIDAKEKLWWIIVMFPWEKDINVLKARMDNEMKKYPETRNWFLAYFIAEPTLEWFEVTVSDSNYDYIVDGLKYSISPYKFEKKLISSSLSENCSEVVEKTIHNTKDSLWEVFND